MTRVIRGIGWTLIMFGATILLYLVYLLFFTNLRTDKAQEALLTDWDLQFQPVEEATPATEPVDEEVVDVEPGDAYAAIWFTRPDGERIVHGDPLYVVEGTTLEHLKDGPGHYTETAPPGHEGNFAISGHRTTYGAPFYHLDDLAPGDEVHVVDRESRHWVYVVRETAIVQPNDVWVIGEDPLDTGEPTMTLTTCHPRFSAAQRYIVFAELSGSAAAA